VNTTHRGDGPEQNKSPAPSLAAPSHALHILCALARTPCCWWWALPLSLSFQPNRAAKAPGHTDNRGSEDMQNTTHRWGGLFPSLTFSPLPGPRCSLPSLGKAGNRQMALPTTPKEQALPLLLVRPRVAQRQQTSLKSRQLRRPSTCSTSASGPFSRQRAVSMGGVFGGEGGGGAPTDEGGGVRARSGRTGDGARAVIAAQADKKERGEEGKGRKGGKRDDEARHRLRAL